jgi:hypothetical protein
MSDRYLSAAHILALEDRAVLEVPVPEWKTPAGDAGVVCLQEFSALDAQALTKDVGAVGADGLFHVLIHAAVHSPTDRTPLFTTADLDRLRPKNMKVLNRLQRFALIQNAMLVPTPDDIKDITAAGLAGQLLPGDLKNGSGGTSPVASPIVSPPS